MYQGRRDTLLGQQTRLRVNDWEDRGSVPAKVQSSFIRYHVPALEPIQPLIECFAGSFTRDKSGTGMKLITSPM
jgi:hypothetical protein